MMNETAAQQSYMCCEAAVQQPIYSPNIFVSNLIPYLETCVSIFSARLGLSLRRLQLPRAQVHAGDLKHLPLTQLDES